MAIHPPSDLVLDVAAAAHPAKMQAAAARLEQAAVEKSGADFTRDLEAVAKASAARSAAAEPTPAVTSHPAQPAPAAPSPPAASQDESRTKAMEKMEAFFLQTVVDEILPKDAESVFGSGLAGDVWKSMLAEHVAAEIAKSMKFGIAERLAGNHFNNQHATTSSAAVSSSDQTRPGNNLSFLQEQSQKPTDAGPMTSGATALKRS